MRALRFGYRSLFDKEAPREVENFLRSAVDCLIRIANDPDDRMEEYILELKREADVTYARVLEDYASAKYSNPKDATAFIDNARNSIDCTLPPRIRKAAEEVGKKRQRALDPVDDSRERPRQHPRPADDEFYCKACKLVLKKSESENHKKSEMHKRNKKK